MKHIAWILIAGAALGLAGCQKQNETLAPQSQPTEPSSGTQLSDKPRLQEIRTVETAPPPTGKGDESAPFSGAAPLSPTASDPSRPEPLVPPTRTYVVQRGETLWRIAVHHLGDGQRWREIVELNPGLDPNKLRSGQEIRIPGK
jgi:nucleoid-associated protein YgaU